MDKPLSMYLYMKLNWDANNFKPAESKDCMNSATYEFRYMSARRGAQFVNCAPGNAYYLFENLSSEDHENVVN